MYIYLSHLSDFFFFDKAIVQRETDIAHTIYIGARHLYAEFHA